MRYIEVNGETFPEDALDPWDCDDDDDGDDDDWVDDDDDSEIE